MRVFEASLPGVLVITPDTYVDSRGYFKEIFQETRYEEFGLSLRFVQDNFARSDKGVIRGLHKQFRQEQGKLVSCLYGCIYDVAADIEPRSPTFGQYFAVELSDNNHRQLWVPPIYAHGYCVVSECAHVHYKCTNFYMPEFEGGVVWDDPDLNISWPVSLPRVSQKDCLLPSLREMKKNQNEG